MQTKLENKNGLTVTRTASAVLIKNRLVITNAGDDSKIDQSGLNGDAVGLIEVSPIADEQAAVFVGGIKPCEAGAAVAAGDRIMSDATGRGVPRGTTAGTIYNVQGRALSAAANAGELFSLLIERYEIKA